MFTGLVEEMGSLQACESYRGGARLVVSAGQALTGGLKEGDSIAVNGVCLTVSEITGKSFSAVVMPETLRKSNLGAALPGDPLNLERALPLGGRLGGHLVSGHIDAVAEITARRKVGIAWELTLAIPAELERYIAPKGSVCLDGTSLTVITQQGNELVVGLIPHTAHNTILGAKGPGARVNLEVDLLARYLEKLLAPAPAQEPRSGLNLELLAAQGYLE